MSFTHSQKKYLKKNLKKFSLAQIAKNLNLSEKEILHYLKNIWSKEKYRKFLQLARVEVLPTNGPLPRWLNWKILVFLAFLVLAVYFNSLGNDFVSDDIGAIKENPLINQVAYFWKAPYFNISPRTIILFLTNKIFDLNPISYRLTNVFFHLGSVWIIYLLVSLFFKRPIPFFTAGIFAVHPILTESVTWISGGPYCQGSFFVLCSFLFYLLAKNKQSFKIYLLSLFFFYISLLNLNKLVVFPAILILYELLFGGLKANWKKLLPFLGISGFWVLHLGGLIGQRITALQTSFYQQPGMENPLTQIPIAITSYLELIFWPKNLTLYHSEMSFTQGEYLLKLAIFILFLAGIAYFFKKDRRISFWLIFFPLSLLTTLTPLRIGWIVAERYVYLGSLGIIVFIAWLISQTGRWFKNQKIAWIIFSLIILVLATRTVVRNFDWKNQDTLWLATAKTSPSSHQNYNNLGDMYARYGDYQKAIEEFQKAIELKPNYGDAYHNLANVYHLMNRDDLAQENYEKALSFNPNLWQSYQNLAAIYFIQEKFDLAKEFMEKAIKINPENIDLHINMGILYSNLGDKQKAKEEFEKALQIDPQNQKAKQQLELMK